MGDIKCVPLRREMCFILCMFCIRSLYNSLSDSSLFRCGRTVVTCDFHSVSSSVSWRWKFASMLLGGLPLLSS